MKHSKHYYSPILAIVPMVISLVILVGWHTKTHFLVQFPAESSITSYNSAICMLLISIGLVFMSSTHRKIHSLFAYAGGIFALFAIIQSLSNGNIGLNELLMNQSRFTYQNPGNITFSTAFFFLLSAISLIYINRSTYKFAFSGAIGAMIFGFGFIAASSAFFQSHALDAIVIFSNVPFPIAVGFIFIGMGISVLSWKLTFDSAKRLTSINWINGFALSLIVIAAMMDIGMPTEIFNGAQYLFLILFTLLIPTKNSSLLYASISTLLILAIPILKPEEFANSQLIANRFFVVAVIWGFAIAFKNIKEKKRALKKSNANLDAEILNVKRQKAKLQAKNSELKHITFIASHDLKEPLRNIESFGELLTTENRHQLTENGEKYLDFILDSSKRMNRLVNGLVEYSRIGNTEKQQQQVDCNMLLANVCDQLSDVIKKTKTNITFNAMPTIYGVEQELKTLFTQIVKNAIKFRNSYVSPEIDISCTNTGRFWHFKVQDNGIGIESKYKERIFKVFQKLEVNEDFDGCGMGLAQCKKIIEYHGGKIWFESKLTKGTTFHFTIVNLHSNTAVSNNKTNTDLYDLDMDTASNSIFMN